MVDYYDGNSHSTRVIPDRDSELPKVAGREWHDLHLRLQSTAFEFSKCTASRLIALGEDLFANTFVFIYFFGTQLIKSLSVYRPQIDRDFVIGQFLKCSIIQILK